MLGWEMERALRDLGFAGEVVSLGRDRLDITRWESVARVFEEREPAAVLNCAAYTDVDGAETEREAAYGANVTGVENLSRACRETGARLVHFSTDQVFDGTGDRPRVETDRPNPLNYYAETKLLGEEKALAFSGTLLFRVQWLYGLRKDRFSPLRGRDLFTPFADQIGSPTWTRDLAMAVLACLTAGGKGLFHFSYDNWASWFDVFSRVKERWALPVKLVPRRTDEILLPARRPLYGALSNAKLRELLGVAALGTWEDSLDRFLDAATPGGNA